MRRLAILLLALSAVVACEDRAAEAEAEMLVKASKDAWSAARRSITLTERIDHLKRSRAARAELEKRYGSTRTAKEAIFVGEGDLAKSEQVAATCTAPPFRACLLAEAEKRIEKDEREEAIQLAILLRVTREQRFADRLKALFATKRWIFDSDTPGELAAANAGDLLDQFIVAASANQAYRAAAVALFLKKDHGGYAAMLDKMRSEGGFNDVPAADIAEKTRDRVLFAEALKKAAEWGPERIGLVMTAMAQAGMADEVRAVAARKEPPLPDPGLVLAALAIVAGTRGEVERLAELERSLKPAPNAASPGIWPSWFTTWGLALGWARAGRVDESAAKFRAGLGAEEAPEVLAAIALAHARAGRAREAIDVLLALDLGAGKKRTAVVRAFADVAEALR